MIEPHLSVGRLEPGAEPPLSDAEQAHLQRCPRCRVEARLLAEMSLEVPDDLPGLDIARAGLSLMRSSIMQGFSTHTQLMGESSPDRSVEEVLAQIPDRHYITLGPIGVGGMGEVWRVTDQRLQRQVAMKWLKASRAENAAVVERFIQEARVTAQLQHPGIVPVHAFGRLPDGRPYFTMKEVQGRTLLDVVAEVHDASSWGLWLAGPSGWTFRRLIDAFHRACEAVAYAHSEGVIHRDLKPANMMVGAYGEVQVLDWGLAKVLAQEGDVDPLMGELDEGVGPQETRAGSIVGTLPYMPPEQARGLSDQVGPQADVYALGATLYHILTGRPPYVGLPDEVIAALGAGPPPPVSVLVDELGLPPVPADLIRICQSAMARQPEDRPQDASFLAAEVAAWLDGARRRERALKVVSEADALQPRLHTLRKRAAALAEGRDEARRQLPPDAPLRIKRPVWAMEDRLAELADEIAVLEVQYLQLLRASLTHEPDLSEAHTRLADYHRAAHAEAEARRDRVTARRHEVLLRAHGDERYARYLKGDGSLTLRVAAEGAHASLSMYRRHDRRLVAEGARDLGPCPVLALPLEMGSYLVELSAPGHLPARYPVHIRRQSRWDGAPPGASDVWPIPLMSEGSLGKEDVYIPAGYAFTGGDPHAQESWPGRRVWVDGFVMRRFPVTNNEYLIFLNDLVAKGQGDEARARAPRERAGPNGERGAIIYARDGDGLFSLGADADDDRWHGDWPVIMISWHDAMAYARWMATRTGLPWRLPHELEWEKAARGVDGRIFPWGDDFEPLYCCMRESPVGRRSPAVIDSFPEDESPYGVRGMAGNVGDWCLNLYDGHPPADGERLVIDGAAAGEGPRAKRGGTWQHDAQVLRVAERHGLDPSYHSYIIGFRLARPL